MERIAGSLASKSVTVIICSEASTTAILSMVGYRNSNGYGKVLHIAATKDVIELIVNYAWECENVANTTSANNSKNNDHD